MKNLKLFKFIFILLASFSFVPNIYADYKVIGSGSVDYNLEDENGYTAGGAAKIYLQDTETGNEITAYCKDPYVAGYTDENNATYQKVPISADKKAAYESIFANTCGDENAQVVATKKYAINSNDTYGSDESIKKMYDNLEGYGTDSEKDELNKIVDEATKAAEKSKTSTGSSSKLSYVKMEGMVKITGPSAISVEADPGITCSGTGTTEVICQLGTCEPGLSYYVIAYLEGADVDTSILPGGSFPGMDGGGSEYPGEGDGDGTPGDGGDSGGDPSGGGSACAPCEVQMFRSTVGGVVQEFVACVEGNGNSRDKGGSTGNGNLVEPGYGTPGTPGGSDPGEGTPGDETPGDKYENDYVFDDYIMVDLSCEGEPEGCDALVELQQGGTEICNASGATVVLIEENFKEVDWVDLYDCVKDGIDVIGANIRATEDILQHENPYCDIYCSEKHEMIMPGPTSAKSDSIVMVNAGTFFDIEGEIKSDTNITCLAQPNYEALVGDINGLRQDVASRMNDYLIAKAYENLEEIETSTCIDYKECDVDDDGDYEESPACGCDTTQYTYQVGPQSYTPITFGGGTADGKHYQTGALVKPEGSAKCTSTVSKSDAKSQCADEKAQMEAKGAPAVIAEKKEAVKAANKELEESNSSSKLYGMIADWKECFGWNYNTLFANWDAKDTCNPSVEFEYYDYYTGVLNIEGDITQPIRKPADKKSSLGIKEGTENEPKNPIIDICNPDTENCYNTKVTATALDYYLTYQKGEYSTSYQHNNLICNPYDVTQPMKVIGNESECPADYGTVFKGFPVSLDTTRGEYWYEYLYSGLGHNFGGTECSSGRLDGIAVAQHFSDDDFNNMCKYGVNNCSNCGFGCIDRDYDCDIDFWDCDRRCKVACVGGGCIIDFGAGFLGTYRTISPNDPFPNVAFFGAPSNAMLLAGGPLLAFSIPGLSSTGDVSSTNDFNKTNWTGPKGDKAKTAISAGEAAIYGGDPLYRIELTPGKIEDIKEYNSANADYIKLDDGAFVPQTDYAGYKSNFITDYFNGENDIRPDVTWTKYDGDYDDSFVGPAYK